MLSVMGKIACPFKRKLSYAMLLAKQDEPSCSFTKPQDGRGGSIRQLDTSSKGQMVSNYSKNVSFSRRRSESDTVSSQQRNNNSNESDTPRRTVSDLYRDCQYSGRVVRVEGDGRCLFRSLATCRNDQLQKAHRDEFGCPLRHVDSLLETELADDLRHRVVQLMKENAHFYSQLAKAIVNADQVGGRKVSALLTFLIHYQCMSFLLSLYYITIIIITIAIILLIVIIITINIIVVVDVAAAAVFVPIKI